MQCHFACRAGRSIYVRTDGEHPAAAYASTAARAGARAPTAAAGDSVRAGLADAGLFDDRRRRVLDVRQPPFSQAVQLPLVADLDDADLLKFLVTDLHDLLRPYHDVSDARVQAEAAKRQPEARNPSTRPSSTGK